jgi:hypothetical protein
MWSKLEREIGVKKAWLPMISKQVRICVHFLNRNIVHYWRLLRQMIFNELFLAYSTKVERICYSEFQGFRS